MRDAAFAVAGYPHVKRFASIAILLALLALLSGAGLAQSVSQQSGLWSNPDTWADSTVPASGASVTISTGTIVYIDISATTGELDVQSGATLQDSATVTLTVGTVSGTDFIDSGAVNLRKHQSTLKMGSNTTWSGNGGDTLYTWDLGGTNRTATLGTNVVVVLMGPSVTNATGPIIDLGRITPGTASAIVFGSTTQPQTVTALNYDTLRWVTHTALTLDTTGTIGIAGVLVTSGGLPTSVKGSTINFNGTAAQTVTAFTYNNLTISGTRSSGTSVTLATGTINVGGTFSASARFRGGGGYITTGNTMNFNGTGAQTVPAFSYATLSINGTRTGNVTLSGTINVSGAFNPSATFTSGAYVVTGNTINYNGTASQSISAPFTYNNLTISGARTTNSISLGLNQTITVLGTFTASATFTTGGGYTITGNTMEFKGTGAQTIPKFSYYNLKIDSTAGSRTLAVGTIYIAGTFTPPGAKAVTVTNDTVDFNGVGGQSIPAFNYNCMSITGARGGGSVIILASTGTIGIGRIFAPTATNVTYTISGSTISYNQTVAETIKAFNYNNLTSSSTGLRVYQASGTIGIAGTFTPGTNADTVTGSTISFNGAGAQTVPAFTYYNIALAGSGAKTFAAGTINIKGPTNTVTGASGNDTTNSGTVNYNGTVAQSVLAPMSYYNLTFTNANAKTFDAGVATIRNTFTPNTATIAASSGSTVFYTGPNAQTIQVGSYFNLGSSGAGARTISGTINIAGTFSRGGNGFTTTGSTINYNATANNQFVGPFNYNILTISTASSYTATLSGSDTVSGNFTIGSNSTFKDSTFIHNVVGNWTNNGTFTSTGTVRMSGSNVTIGGTSATTFNTLIINNNGTSDVLSNNITAASLNDSAGATLTTGSYSVTVTNPANRTGAGIIIGTVTLSTTSGSFTTGINYSFEGPYNTIRFTTASAYPTSITSTVTLSAPSDFPAGNTPVSRYYTMSTTGTPTFTATLSLHYKGSELNGILQSNLKMWQYISAWTSLGDSSLDNTDDAVTENNLQQTAFASNVRYTLAQLPILPVHWIGGTGAGNYTNCNWNNTANWDSARVPGNGDLACFNLSANTINHDTVYIDVTPNAPPGGILFGGHNNGKAITLNIGPNAVLTTLRDISISDSNYAVAHIINDSSATVNIGGSLTVSDGTNGHNITFNDISAGTVNITNNLTQAGNSNISITGAGTFNIGANFNFTSSGTFPSTNGTVRYFGSSTQTVAALTSGYNNLIIDKSGGTATLPIGSGVTVNGTLLDSASAASSFVIDAPLTVTGTTTIDNLATMGTGTGAITLKSATAVNSGGTLDAGTGSVTLSAPISIASTGALKANAGTITSTSAVTNVGSLSVGTGTIYINDTLYNNAGGNINGGTGTLSVDSVWSNSSGTLTAGSGTVRFASGGSQTIPGGLIYYTLIVNKPSTTTTTLGGLITVTNLTDSSGSIFDGGYQITGNAAGFLTIAGSNTLTLGNTNATAFPTGFVTSNISLSSSSTVIYNSNQAQTISGIPTYGNLVDTSTVPEVKTATGALTVNGNFTISSNTQMRDSSFSHLFYGNFINNGVLNGGTGDVIFLGTNDSLKGNAASTTFANLYVPVNLTVTLASDSISDSLYITTAGTYNALSTNITKIAGPFTDSGVVSSAGTINFGGGLVAQNLIFAGTFTSNNTVNFNGSASPNFANSTVSEPLFTNLVINNSGGVSATNINWSVSGKLTIDSGATFTLYNADTLRGQLNNKGMLAGIGVQLVFLSSAANDTLAFGGSGFQMNAGTGASVEFAGTGTFVISKPPAQYPYVIISDTTSSGIRVAASNVGWTIGGDLTIDSACTFHAGSASTDTLLGNLNIGGYFSGDTSTVVMNPTAGYNGATASINSYNNAAQLDSVYFYNLKIAQDLNGSVDANMDIHISGNFAVDSTYNANVDPGAWTAYGVTMYFVGSANSVISGNGGTISIPSLYVGKASTAQVILNDSLEDVYSLVDTSGTLDDSSFDIIQNGGSVVTYPGSVWSVGGSQSIPAFTEYYLDPASTVIYSGTNGQTINQFPIYGNLSVSNAGTKYFLTGETDIYGSLSIIPPATINALMDSSTIFFDNQFGVRQVIPAISYYNVLVGGGDSLVLSSDTTYIYGYFQSGPGPVGVVDATDSSSTVNYSGNGAQLMFPTNYYNLILSGSGAKTFFGNDTIKGNLTMSGAASLYQGSSTLTFLGSWFVNTTASRPDSVNGSPTVTMNAPMPAAATRISGSTPSVVTFFNLNINNASGVFYDSVNIAINTGGKLTLGAGVDFIPAPGDTIGGKGTITGAGSDTIQVTRVAPSTKPGILGQYPITTKTLTNLTVDFSGLGAQTIDTITNYTNLMVSGVDTSIRVVTLQSSTTGYIGVSGGFSPATFTKGSYVTTGSTVNFNGAAAETIKTFNYSNLTSSSTGARILASSGIIGVGGTFTRGTNAYTTTGSTMNFNDSTSAQTIPPFDYYNLTISGNRTTNSATLAAGTDTVQGAFTPSATFTGAGAFVTTNDTVNFYGTGAQTVPAFNYNSLKISARANNVTLANGGTIGIAGSFNPAALTNPGVYVTTNNTVNFFGNGQTIPALGGGYNNLTDSTGTTDSLGAAITVNGALKIARDTLSAAAENYSITLGGNWTNNGTFLPGKDTVTFNSTSANQTIGGTAARQTFFNLAVAKGSDTLVLGGSAASLTVFGLCTLTSGTLNIGPDSLILDSTVSGAGSIASTAASTVYYNQASNGQMVLGGNYGNLTFSNFTKGLTNKNIGIAGVFTPDNTGQDTITGSTINFNGSAAQAVPTFEYNNLTISGSDVVARVVTFDTVGTITNNIGIEGTFTPATFTHGSYVVQGSTFSYDGNTFGGSGTQTAAAFAYYNLVLNDSLVVLSSGTTSVAGSNSVTFGGNGFYADGVANSTTFSYVGGSGQPILGTNMKYYNLVTANGVKKLPSAQTVRIAGTFTPGVADYGIANITNDTIDYNGKGAQTITAFDYYNLSIDSSRGANNVTFDTSGTITINGTGASPGKLTANASFTTGGYITTRTTIRYTDTSTIAGQQIVNTIPYYNLIVNAAGTKPDSLGGNITVNGNLTLTKGTLRASTSNYNVDVKGNWINNASATAFTPGTGSVTLDGTTANTLGGTFLSTFYNLTLNDTAGISLTDSITATKSISVGGGIFDLSTYTARGTTGATFTLRSGSTLKIGGTNSFPANFTTDSLAATSTVNYYGGAQTVAAVKYGNLTLSGTSAKTGTANDTLANNLTLSQSLTMPASDTLVMTSATGSNVTSSGGGEVDGAVKRIPAGGFVTAMYYMFNRDSVGFALAKHGSSTQFTINMKPGDSTFGGVGAPSSKYVKRSYGFSGGVAGDTLDKLSLIYLNSELKNVSSELKLGAEAYNGSWSKLTGTSGYVRTVDSINNVILDTNVYTALSGVSEFGLSTVAYQSIKTGSWSANGTWDEAGFPGSGDDAQLDSSFVVTNSSATDSASSVTLIGNSTLNVTTTMTVLGLVDVNSATATLQINPSAILTITPGTGNTGLHLNGKLTNNGIITVK